MIIVKNVLWGKMFLELYFFLKKIQINFYEKQRLSNWISMITVTNKNSMKSHFVLFFQLNKKNCIKFNKLVLQVTINSKCLSLRKHKILKEKCNHLNDDIKDDVLHVNKKSKNIIFLEIKSEWQSLKIFFLKKCITFKYIHIYTFLLCCKIVNNGVF